jgi:hypothetical protein
MTASPTIVSARGAKYRISFEVASAAYILSRLLETNFNVLDNEQQCLRHGLEREDRPVESVPHKIEYRLHRVVGGLQGRNICAMITVVIYLIAPKCGALPKPCERVFVFAF